MEAQAALGHGSQRWVPRDFVALLCGAMFQFGMPTVLRSGPFLFFFFFYSGDAGEPAHVHVERDACTAKFWLKPVRLQESGGFGAVEIRRIASIIEENAEGLLRSWDDYFTN